MSFLNKLFSGKAKVAPLSDYAWLGVDMHSHLIPGIDDGAKTLEESVGLARGFAELGFRKAITTPHIMTDFYRNTPETVRAGLAEVQAAVNAAGIMLELDAAAEYYLDEGLAEKLAAGPLLTFGDRHVLFEVSYINRPRGMEATIFELITQGYKPILAHPERYTFFYNDFDEYREVHRLGALFQLNLLSLAGHYGPHARSMAHRLIDEDLIDLVGSDVHSERHIRGLRDLLGNSYLARLAERAAEGRLLNTQL